MQLWEASGRKWSAPLSRLVAWALRLAERPRLPEDVTQLALTDDYLDVRVSKTGHRFGMNRAMVWNLLTKSAKSCGSAALFDRREFL